MSDLVLNKDCNYDKAAARVMRIGSDETLLRMALDAFETEHIESFMSKRETIITALRARLETPMQAEQQSERERALRAGWNQEAQDLDAVLRLIGLSPEHCRTEGGWLNLPRVRAALSHPSTPQGWKQIGWTCGDGDCGRIHEAPSADGSYAVPVYVQDPPEQGSKG